MNDVSINDIADICKKAGDAILKYYKKNNFDIKLKSDQSQVTDADVVSNDLISTFLKDQYPDIPIVSEESYIPPFEIRKSYEYFWLLDPLDGTKEFINQTDEFSINLALIKNNTPIAGFIYLPVYKKLYFAIKGLGAFSIIDGNKSQLFCNTFSLDDENLKVVISRNHLDKKTKDYLNKIKNPILIKLGSALKFLSIASGEADYYPRMINIMEWDTAAGQVIIEESGGKLVDATTSLPLKYNKPSMFNPYFIASGQII